MAKHGDVATGPGWELRCGDYREVLVDVEPDAVIADPPYSDVTHGGHREGHGLNNTGRPTYRRDISYASWTPLDVGYFVDSWSCRTSGWMVAFTDDQLAPAYRAAYADAGRCPFAPLPFVVSGMTVRLAGDGPSNWTTWVMVARPRTPEMRGWGTLRGAYVLKHHGSMYRVAGVVGAKNPDGMRRVVRDYSRPGDLVCDPCAGGGTTLLAAVLEGRRAIGAELDPVTFDKAVKRLRNHAITPPLFHDEPKRMEQVGLALDDEEVAQ